MHGNPVNGKSKPMLPSNCLRNINGISSDTAESTLSYICWTPYTMLPSTLFRLYQPLSSLPNLFRSDSSQSDHKQTYKEPMSKFLWCGVCCYIGIKYSFPEQISLYEYTLEIVIYMVMPGERRSDPDIWLKTLN